MKVFIKDKPENGSIGKSTFLKDEFIKADKAQIKALEEENYQKYIKTQTKGKTLGDSIVPDSNGDYIDQ